MCPGLLIRSIMKKTNYLYLITREDGAQYVGVTVDPSRRRLEHFKGRGSKFLEGKIFTMEILLEGEEEYVYAQEISYIKTHSPSLNIAKGGNRGPGFIGEEVWTAVLTEEQVKEVKYLLLDTNKSYTDIAMETNISKDTVSSISLGKCWAHVLPELVLPNRAKQEVSSKTLKEILRLRKEGLSYSKIAEKVGVSYNTARNWCIRAEVTIENPIIAPNPRKLSSDIVDKILSLQKDGLSQREIAKELGIGKTTVARHCKEHGVIFTMKSKKTSEVKIQEIIATYTETQNIKDTAEAAKVNITTVKKYLKERGIK